MSDAAKYNIEQVIDNGNKMAITRESLKKDYSFLLGMRDLYMYLKERKDAEDKPDKERIKARKEGFESYMKRLEVILEKAEPVLMALNAQIKTAEGLLLAEITKKNDIRGRHIEFVNDTAKMIVTAPDNKELARIQKLIGTEKSRTGFYGDYHPVIEEVCNSLLKLIDERKAFVKNSSKLEADFKKWSESGDMPRAAQIKEEMELMERVVNENALAIAQDAYTKVAGVQIEETEFISEAVVPRTHRWSWRVDNIETLYQKMPELVIKEPNVKAINEFMKKKTDELDETKDNNFNGLVLYRKPYFVSIKSNKDDAS